jgi:hypothetical protein
MREKKSELFDIVGIVIFTKKNLMGYANVKEILYGIEEEEVPFEIWQKDLKTEDIVSAAHAAAMRSIFNVGVCCSKDVIIIHHCKLERKNPLFYLLGDQCTRKNARYIGNNAARFVKGLPFFEIT